MLRLLPETRKGRPLRLLCIGAHSDDLEIGCAGTVLTWLAETPAVEVSWVVLSAEGVRGEEARSSARALLGRARASRVVVTDFRDCFFQSEYLELKSHFETLKREIVPDVVLTHHLEDRHQDHRLTAELSWNTWRDQLVLEYEIPKYEGDLATPNAYVPLSRAVAKRKVAHLERCFPSQQGRDWFTADTFLGLMRLRGLESRSPSGLAEGFHARKLVL